MIFTEKIPLTPRHAINNNSSRTTADRLPSSINLNGKQQNIEIARYAVTHSSVNWLIRVQILIEHRAVTRVTNEFLHTAQTLHR